MEVEARMNEAKIYDALIKEQQQRKWPPIDQWHPHEIEPGEMYVDKGGAWFHEGSRINRKPLVKLFASILRREPKDRQYYLITPHNKVRVIVEDVPFLIVDFHVKNEAGAQAMLMVSNLGDIVPVGAEHPLEARQFESCPVPYIRVRGELFARMNRSAYYRLAALIEENYKNERRLGIWSEGLFHSLA